MTSHGATDSPYITFLSEPRLRSVRGLPARRLFGCFHHHHLLGLQWSFAGSLLSAAISRISSVAERFHVSCSCFTRGGCFVFGGKKTNNSPSRSLRSFWGNGTTAAVAAGQSQTEGGISCNNQQRVICKSPRNESKIHVLLLPVSLAPLPRLLLFPRW